MKTNILSFFDKHNKSWREAEKKRWEEDYIKGSAFCVPFKPGKVIVISQLVLEQPNGYGKRITEIFLVNEDRDPGDEN